MMEAKNCLFCKIIDGKIPTQFIAQNEHVVAFKDINPVSPTHILVVPRQHVACVADLQKDKLAVSGHMIAMAQEVAKEQGLSDYRLVINNGLEAGQSVFHLHMHVLGGRKMSWPPG